MFHISPKLLKKEKTAVDKLVYGAAIVAPIMIAPQAYIIWKNQSAINISIHTWVTFLVISFVWFAYGWLHKEKPIILTNGLFIIMEIWLVAGAIIYS